MQRGCDKPAMRPLLVLAIISLLFSLPSERAAAQERPPAMASVLRANLEPSYLVIPINLSGLPPVWYEANVVAHFVAHREHWPFAIVLTPKVVLRLFRERSEPVKTPSYMPRLALFAWLEQSTEPGASLHYASLSVLHHSNGQAGPEFLPGRALNHESGNFSTNYLELALHGLHPDRELLRWTRVGLEWHPVTLQQSELAGRYGSLRLQLDATLLEQSFGGTLSASVGLLMGSFGHYAENRVARQLERFPMSISYSVAFKDIEIALFARYYMGRDYYNIWFDRTVHMLQIGISSHIAPLLGSES